MISQAVGAYLILYLTPGDVAYKYVTFPLISAN